MLQYSRERHLKIYIWKTEDMTLKRLVFPQLKQSKACFSTNKTKISLRIQQQQNLFHSSPTKRNKYYNCT